MNSVQQQDQRKIMSLLFCGFVFFATVAGSLLMGHVPWDAEIIAAIRLPRVCLAVLCGGSLALAGWLCQGLFRNPLATPSILGIESCAAFLGATWSLLTHHHLGFWSLPIATMAGASILTSLLIYYGRKTPRAQSQLLILGFSLNALFGALTSFSLAILAEDQPRDGTLLFWLFGDLASRDWVHTWMVCIALLFGIPLARQCIFPFQILAMGREHALSAGIDLRRIATIALLSCGVLIGGSAAAAGSIPFVGFVAPLVTRKILGSQHRLLPWVCMINGASLVCAADLAARTVRHPYDLNVGLVVALVGTPIFIASLFFQKKETGTYR